MATLQDRMLRAAKLDVDLYEEVEADQSATQQAMLVVVLSSVAAGLGAMGSGGGGLGTMLIGTVTALVAWFIWAFLTYFIGTKILPQPQTSADMGELLRTIGFSSSPGVIRIMGIIPGLYIISTTVASIWMLVAMVIAVRQALDYDSTLRAVGVCIIGWLVQIMVLAGLFSLFGSSSY
ncbi:MAG: YIP1 family protein [Calditrichaeota bacterium]|nr:YIP1 family protein [Calditrichota bacterium]